MAIEMIELDGRRPPGIMASVGDRLAVTGDDALDAGDRSAAALVDLEARHGQALFGFVRRLGLSDDQAADCVQEVLLRLWAETDRGIAIRDPRAWVFRSVYRLAMDEHRLRRRITGLVGLLGWRSATAPSPVDDTDRIAVWSEVDRLPIRQRQVLYLRYRADLPFEEIGQVLGMTASAARSHATQAMATLRRRLGSDGSTAGEQR
jgi:RNA polymerase sigma factor (sigma-70 family)